MTQLLVEPQAEEAIASPPAGGMGNLTNNSATISSGGRALAELQRRKQAAEQRIATRLAQIEAAEQGIDVGRPEVGGNGVKNFVVLTSTDDDERFFRQCQQDPLLMNYFGGGSGNGNSGSGGSNSATAPSTANSNSNNETGQAQDGAASKAGRGRGRGRGILGFAARYKPFGWLSTNRLAVFGLSGVFLLLGLICLVVVFASLGRGSGSSGSTEIEATTTAAPVILVNPTATVGLEATITAQARQLTAIANQPTLTATATALPKTATATALPTTPTATATPDFSQDPHNGLLPPAKLSASKLGFNNDKVRRFATSADGQTLVSGPPKGVLYHFGAYPGERPGNLVLIGDYETLGNWFELLQVNDLMEVTDRNGGVYTYRVLSWQQISQLATQTSSSSNTNLTPTPTLTPGGGNGADAYAQATAVAAIPDQLEKVTTWQDTGLVEKPLNPNLSILTLVSLGKPGEEAGRRYAVRARFVSYNPQSNLPPGTPVALTIGPVNPNPNVTLTAPASITPR